MSWGAADGASSYSVQAVGNQVPVVHCSTNNTSCSLSGLQCSHIYNVTVTARNKACDSMTSEIFHLMTGLFQKEKAEEFYMFSIFMFVCLLPHSAPCPPTNVQASFACEDLTAAATWQQSNLAVGYVAHFENQNGHSTSCVGTDSDTSCEVSGLTCGTAYDVWVKALGQPYNSSDSSVVSLTSGKKY